MREIRRRTLLECCENLWITVSMLDRKRSFGERLLAGRLGKRVSSADIAAGRALAIFRLLLDDYHPRNFTISFWDGTEWPAENDAARFTLKVKSPGALRRILMTGSSDLSISEAYISGEVDIAGDFEAAMPLASYLMNRRWRTGTMLRLGALLLQLPKGNRLLQRSRKPAELSGKQHSIQRDRQAVTYHYNVSNQFYALWLDNRMVYSCAYFETDGDSLDAAQTRKLDYLCRKLRLRPGERLLDIGCGWGALVIHAAREYGAQTLGITLSENQAKLANNRIVEAGLQHQCRVEVADYRALDSAGGFDKVVSVGMVEHVGESHLPVYFRQAWRLLRPGGVFLNHGIANRPIDPVPKGPTFISRYVFPDGELVPINVTLRYAEDVGFEVRDVESLREHYALTLRHWARSLELHRADALKVVEEPIYRIWRLFLHGSACAFAAGFLNVYQSLLVKPNEGRSGLPLTRADWYLGSHR
jgi:cyclopropane-fatty-acyl-phospholipid synthase